MPPVIAEEAGRADLILHAGDVCEPSVLAELAAFAPTKAVLGNNDGPEIEAWGATPTLEFDLDGVRIAMLHNASTREGRAARLHKKFPDADLVLYGHSHQPVDDATGPVHIFNPGSPTDPRREPVGTYGIIEIVDGVVRTEIKPVPKA